MNYIIDPKVFSAVFTVPAAVADKHLKLASGEHIRCCFILCGICR